jgi:hypothetical protein
MSFPVQPHNAEKVQHDINTILEAIARFLQGMGDPQIVDRPYSEPPLTMTTELENEDYVDLDVLTEREALPYWNPKLLKGGDYIALSSQPIVQLQIGETYIVTPLSQLPQQLEQLPTPQLTALAGAIEHPALPPGKDDPELTDNPAIIDVKINGSQCFYQNEQGQTLVNTLGLKTVTTEIGEVQPQLPTVELRPAAEVESLTGMALGDSSPLHSQVLHNAPAIRVDRDQFGHIKGGAAIKAAVEVTEDSVEAQSEYELEHQPLTPAAKEVTAYLHNYFQKTGEKQLPCENDYDIRLDEEKLLFVPRNNPTEVVTVEGNQAISISPERIQHLMVRFAAAYESIRTTEQNQDQDIELSR